VQGLDTSVWVRLLLKDDAHRARTAKAEIDRARKMAEPLLASLLRVLESEWVLQLQAGLAKAEVMGAFKLLLEARELQFDDKGSLERALLAYEEDKADFAECLLMTHYSGPGCSTMLTFDAAKGKLPGCSRLTA
jgi:predicted nucleic-acid-binding protein